MNSLTRYLLNNSVICAAICIGAGLAPFEPAHAVPIDITFSARQLGPGSYQNYVINYSVYKITLTDPVDFILTVDSDDPNAGGTLRYSYDGNAEIRYYGGSRPVLTTTKATLSGSYEDVHYWNGGTIDKTSDVALNTFLTAFATKDGGTHTAVIDNTGNLPAQAYLGFGIETHTINMMAKENNIAGCSFCFLRSAAGAQFTGWFVGSSPTLGNISGDSHLRLTSGFNIGHPPPSGEVPEPMTIALLLPSLAGLAMRRKIQFT